MDKKRILGKIKELDGYLEELDSVRPKEFEDYTNSISTKRSCERILQISIEIVLDICNVIISNLNLGIPSDESDIFSKLKNKKVINEKMAITLDEMKGFRNILVHRYGIVDDEKVFEVLSDKLSDFEEFKSQILKYLK
jgi:uncharacterized protein YutE (UPF0331/DUF86 family)